MARLALLLTVALANSAYGKHDLPTPIPDGAHASFVIDPTPPGSDLLPQPYVLVPGTSFIMMQFKGGNLLLGPLLGGLNVKHNSKELAKSSVGGYMGVDPVGISTMSLALIGIDSEPKPAAYTIKPYAYVEQCGDDEMYRVALAYQVNAPAGSKKAWAGRYLIHLPTPIPFAQFTAPGTQQVAAFTAELTASADALTNLLAREIRGELPATGREVFFGSLYLTGTKIGGAGIYTMAKDISVENSQLIDERDGNVVVRVPWRPSTYWFGTHLIQRRLVHTLRDAN
jgi:hypothetical protein